jgi:uncharacterized OB-fold protein
MTVTEPLVADHVLDYPGGYTRSVGPVIGRFLTGLRDGRLLAVRLADGRVLVPPTEYDPSTSEPVGDDVVEVGPAGRVQSWTWVSAPRAGKHPLDRPFAFALVRPDGADTALLHVVDAGSPDAMSVGLRVAPRWRAQRTGHLTDIEAWVPLADGDQPRPAPDRTPSDDGSDEGPVTGITSPVHLEYRINAGAATTRYLQGLAQGKILGGRAPGSDEVYAASRGTDPKTGEPTSVEVEVRDSGVVTTFCIVNIPGLSELAPEIPYVSAQILLDGANNTFFGLIRGVEVDDVRMGMRVRAVWAEELKADHTSIKWWEPTGEDDAPYEHYRDYL